jgi:ACS family hexuronate transporter-like MFS transporter
MQAATIPSEPRGTIKNLRWWIAGLLALATALNYLDRQSFPVVIGEIRKEIPITNEQYGQLTSLFLLAYAIMYAGGGRIMDWLGTRAGYAVMIVWWSAANLFTGTVSSVLGLGVFRFLLGMGEGGGFPGSGKAVAEWFPPRERSLAFGIFNAGSSVGAVIAPPLMALIVSTLGWRAVFFITGSIGFVWAWIWLEVYQPPVTNRFITPEEKEFIAASLNPKPGTDGEKGSTSETHSGFPGALPIPSGEPPGRTGQRPVLPEAAAPRISWFRLFTYRQVLGLMAAKFLTDSAWYFFIFWLPKYLGDVRHLNIREIGYFAWIPYAFAGVGSLLGGWLSSFLIRSNLTLNLSRKIAFGISASLMPASLFIASSPLSFAIVFFSLAMFAHQFWSANVQTLPADLFPAKVVGSVEGLLGSAGSFGGMLFGLLVGRLVEHQGYGPAFLVAGVLHPMAFLVILATVKRIGPIHSGANPLSTASP